MKFIHKLTEESYNDLKSMLLTDIKSNIKFAVEIMNNLDLNDELTKKYESKLFEDIRYLYKSRFIPKLDHENETYIITDIRLSITKLSK